ncbi:MAG TPA: uL15 family ribosomal protein [Nitrososphaeraceae archaeon]|jgi:large subunit ribosomal protein L15
MATRLRKSRRHRGTRYCGWGQIGQHRQSGSRGGIGGAGKHKHFWIRTVIEEPDHFGHDTLNSYSRFLVKKWINLRDLRTLSIKFSDKKDQKTILDLGSLGIQKLLGGGSINESYVIKVAQASASAKKKVESAGGNIISNEHSAQ